MADARGYDSPAAFRRALTDKLKNAAKESRWTLQQLQRQMAYDRLLERLYLVDDGWIVKGAAALLARGLGVRATIDIDVFRNIARETAEREVRDAAGRDIGDWFRFEVGPPQAVRDGAFGTRLPVKAYIGTTMWADFHVDLVGSEATMTGEPERVPALARVVMPDVEQHGLRRLGHRRDLLAEAMLRLEQEEPEWRAEFEELYGRALKRPRPSEELVSAAPGDDWGAED